MDAARMRLGMGRVGSRVRSALAPLVTLLMAAPASAASLAYSDFGPGGTYGTSYWCTMGVAGSCDTTPETQYNGAGFTPARAGVLDSINIAVFYVSGLRGISVSLVPDNGSGAPAVATPLEQWIVTTGLPNNAFPAYTKPLRLSSKLNPALTAGNTYWIVTMPLGYDSSAGWSLNSKGVGASQQIESLDGGVSWNHFGDAPAFNVWYK